MNSHPTIEQVDAAVKAVLGAFRRTTAVGPSNTHVFHGRLLGERHVKAIDPSMTIIGLTPGTVITPIARDMLKQRGITVRLLHPDRIGQARAGTWGFAIEGDSGLASGLRRSLLSGLERWDEIELTEAASWAGAASDRGIAVLTLHPALTVWNSNRAQGVRAASACDLESLSRAIDDLGINLLAIDPTGQTLFSIKHLLADFRRRGVPSPPTGWNGGCSHEDRRSGRPPDLLTDSRQPASRPFSHHSADAFIRVAGGIERTRR